MLSIGALSSAAQGASYYERDGYYAKDDPEHRDASAWAGKGADELGLKGPVDADTFRAVLEGRVPDGSDTRLGKRGKDGGIVHRPGRDLTFSAPKSVSIAGLVGGDRRIVEAHDRAVAATLAWVEKNAAETRMKDPGTGKMARVGGQKIVAAAFRHDTSRNLDPRWPPPCRRATCCASRPSCACPAWCWSATPSNSTRWTPASPSPSSRPQVCRPRPWTRSCASAIPC